MQKRSFTYSTWVVTSLTAWLVCLVACSSSSNTTGIKPADEQQSELPPAANVPSDFAPPTTDTDPQHGKLSIVGASGEGGEKTILVSSLGTAVTEQLEATFADGTKPSNLTWSVSDASIATVSSDGLLRTGGVVGGVVEVTAQVGSVGTKFLVTVKVDVVDDNPGNVAEADRTKLMAGGSDDSKFVWLYPYDKTVFPLDLPAPELQFGGRGADALYVKITSPYFSYGGFVGGSSPTRLALSSNVWRGLTYSNAGATNAVSVQITKLRQGKAAGPISESWVIARGKLKGLFYYNTYTSSLPPIPPTGNNDDFRGAVMRLKPSEDHPTVLQAGCTVCHSVSAKGNKLVAGIMWGGGEPRDSGAFNLTADGQMQSIRTDEEGKKYAFGALSPDGSVMIGNASGTGIRGLDNFLASNVYETNSGNVIESNLSDLGLTKLSTPAFSLDGTKVAFSRADSDSNTLSLLDYGGNTSPAVFSNLQDIATASRSVAGWPSFLPDSQALAYHDGTRFDTETDAKASIKLVSLATKAIRKLDALNGVANGGSYLPYQDVQPDDFEKNYEPTVIPAAAGGYYWVVFTSRRSYGNRIAPGTTVRGIKRNGDVKDYDGGKEYDETSPRKKLWVAAINLNYDESDADPSHPAFYLPGQEFEAGNMRAFAALEPCKADGNSCDTGIDCCGGFCRQTGVQADGSPLLQCAPPTTPNACANEDEACETAANCCNSSFSCTGGRCTRPAPVLR